MASKIQLYSMATPNGQKIGVALEEMGLAYEPHTINILKNETFTPEFIKLNPNSKIPVIVDPDGPDGKPITIVESGAILLYLAEKSGKFLSKNPRHRWETIQWLMFQMPGVGPMIGQFGHFLRSAKEKCKDPCPLQSGTATRRSACWVCWRSVWKGGTSSSTMGSPSPTWRSSPGSDPRESSMRTSWSMISFRTWMHGWSGAMRGRRLRRAPLFVSSLTSFLICIYIGTS